MKSFYPVVLLLVFIISSCIKERCQTCKQTNDPGLKCITFTCDYSAQNQTKGSTKPFPAGIQTSIVTYNAGDNPANRNPYPGTPVIATSEANGNLVLNMGVFLFMPNGNYDFYSFSDNSSVCPEINFVNGISGNLSNRKDYLWATFKNMNITANTFVPLQFSHRAAAISLTIVAGEGVSSLVVDKILISQAKEGAAMSLTTGKIPAAEVLSSENASMILTNNTGTIITLPIKAGISLSIEVYADLNYGGIIYDYKRLTAIIPSPVGGFESGSLYKYSASVDAYRIIFNKSSIEDWKDQILLNISLIE